MKISLSDNYFNLFQMSESMEIDLDLLDERFKSLQRELHPDRFINSSDTERRWSMQATSLVNQARQALLNPLSRACYLLSLSGIDLDTETDTRMSGGFLMAQMELRETLDIAKNADEPFEKLDELNRQVASMTKDIREAFNVAYNDGSLDLAREKAREWQFLNKLKLEIDEIESILDDY